MNTEQKILELLIASGNVTIEKVEQARSLALSLKWDSNEEAEHGVQSDVCHKSIDGLHHFSSDDAGKYCYYCGTRR